MTFVDPKLYALKRRQRPDLPPVYKPSRSGRPKTAIVHDALLIGVCVYTCPPESLWGHFEAAYGNTVDNVSTKRVARAWMVRTMLVICVCDFLCMSAGWLTCWRAFRRLYVGKYGAWMHAKL